MKFSAALIALVAASLPALAVPTAEPEPVPAPVSVELAGREATPAELEKRDNNIYVCEGSGFTGRCVTYYPDWNVCAPWSALGLSGLQAWGPGEGVYCIWYNEPCGSSDVTASDTFTYPGFSTVPGYWQFNTQSWKCWW
ncbi:hypothetical protein BC835DRAFT_1309680 [Cytidiella melzeri]|nr:hypothetical protein BC835DRAFT_1309680 [Cytidiella melzeri]